MTNRKDLVRVRNLAALAASLETLKMLPLVDGVITLVEWVGVKTVLPVGLEIVDAIREKRFTWKTPFHAAATGHWFALVARAFGGAGGSLALLADVGTDVEAILLPPPLDGFDAPPMLADALIAVLAHRALAKLDRAEEQRALPGAPAESPAT